MSLNRRSFIKRSGMTLGGVIGLGAVAPLTRKMYATDTSYGVSGIRIDCSQQTVSSSFGVWGGLFTLTMQLSVLRKSDKAALNVGVCYPGTVTVRIFQTAAFNITKDGIVYNGTAYLSSFIDWICVEGVPTLIYRLDTSPTLSTTAPVDSIPPGSPRWGAIQLDLEVSEDNRGNRIKGSVFKGYPDMSGGEWSPDTSFTNWLTYTPVCCTF